ncbi:MAG TPA: GSCFA domain protein [Saprospiraceae bacterium]|nr:GSCFA domain protein [Saprospiraceae bacterium]
MKPFRTILHALSKDLNIQHQSGVCLIGSCFSEHIGHKLDKAKFKVLQNPFGILYNPFSIAKSLQRIITNRPFTQDDLVAHNGLWVSFEHHSRFSDVSRELALKKMNQSLENAHHFLKSAKVIFISLGTAKVYRLKSTKKTVANCHKFPATSFDHSLSEKKEIVAVLAQALQALQTFNPGLNVLFTVSPVRHLKDGFVENQRSKSTLLLAVAKLQEQFTGVDYFPSYEIMLDDLRDYRFYESDLVHPNPLAVDYIFDFFGRTYFDKSTTQLIRHISKIQDAVNHRPFHPASQAYQVFLTQTIQKIATLQAQHPFLDFRKEEELLRQRRQSI